MRNLARPGVGGNLLHKLRILTVPCIGRRVFEVEVLEDIVRSKLNTGLLIADCPLRSDIAHILLLRQNLLNVPGKVSTALLDSKVPATT